MPEEERSYGTISNKTYFAYMREGGNTILAVILIAAFLVSEVISHTILRYLLCNVLHLFCIG